jgi:phosphoglycerate dehydrogenase-like enzyme
MRRAVFNMRDERPVWAPPAEFVRRLRRAFPSDWEVLDIEEPVSGRGDGSGTSAAARNAIRGAEVYLGLGLPRDLLLAGLETPTRLRWIHTGAAGVASLLHAELVESDVVLTNSAGVHAPPIAETVIGMMLHFARGLDRAVRAQQEAEWCPGAWESSENGIRELGGATLGLVGYGGIGREIARRARALDMRVVALRRSTAPDELAEVLTGADALGLLLERSDFVVLCLPATAQTRGMIGRRELERMRPGAVLINVARGSIIDEAALVDVLSAGRLRGAGLDVFAAEPLPPDSPLWRLPHVLITPHVSATSPRYWEREGELILTNVRRYLAGEDLLNVVDTAAGY